MAPVTGTDTHQDTPEESQAALVEHMPSDSTPASTVTPSPSPRKRGRPKGSTKKSIAEKSASKSADDTLTESPIRSRRSRRQQTSTTNANELKSETDIPLPPPSIQHLFASTKVDAPNAVVSSSLVSQLVPSSPDQPLLEVPIPQVELDENGHLKTPIVKEGMFNDEEQRKRKRRRWVVDTPGYLEELKQKERESELKRIERQEKLARREEMKRKKAADKELELLSKQKERYDAKKQNQKPQEERETLKQKKLIEDGNNEIESGVYRTDKGKVTNKTTEQEDGHKSSSEDEEEQDSSSSESNSLAKSPANGKSTPEIEPSDDKSSSELEDCILGPNTEPQLMKPSTTLEIDQLKSKIFPKLITSSSNSTPPQAYELENKIDEIYKMFASTINDGLKNSCFLFGPRNSGKTLAVNSAMHRLSENFHASKYITIRLNGSAYVDDKTAFRAIADQLDSEIARIYEVRLRDLGKGELLGRKSITETISNILRILDDEVNLNNKRDEGNAKLRIPIIFIIDEVENYVTQFRQTLLYNLFDLSQSSVTPITVICSTSVYNIRESLEKRVRSRFSQRFIQFGRFEREKFLDICGKLIKVDEPENDYEKQWNDDVDELLNQPGSDLRRSIIFNHLTECDLAKFQIDCIYPLQKLNSETPRLQDSNFAKVSSHLLKASMKATVNKLSDLELSLLIAAARVTLKHDLKQINFNMTYEEYLHCLSLESTTQSSTSTISTTSSKSLKQWSKQQCQESWELLILEGLLTKPNLNNNRMVEKFGSVGFETRLWCIECSLDDVRRTIGVGRIMRVWTRL